MAYKQPDQNGFYGRFGGRFVPETLMTAVLELEEAYRESQADPSFQAELDQLLKQYVGRETPLYYAKNLTKYVGGAKIFLKREDLNHTGAHKINNALGQVLLAHRMGKKKIIAETGAGQHGVATATAAALFGMECTIYMGEEDVKRQALNVFRMELLGAKVQSVTDGSRVLKDAVNAALRAWVANVEDTHYIMGSALGPHPFPEIVRDFQSVIGREAKRQFAEQNDGALPNAVLACVGGGSNAIGLFYPYICCHVWGRSCWAWSRYRPACSNLDQGTSGSPSRCLDGCFTGCPWTDFRSLLDFSRSRLPRNWARAFLFP